MPTGKFAPGTLEKMQAEMQKIAKPPKMVFDQVVPEGFGQSQEPKVTIENTPVGFGELSWGQKKKVPPKPLKEPLDVDGEKSFLKLLKVGADVEEFLVDLKGNPVPVIGLIGGTKQEPLPILRAGFALQEDNVALEYNIPPASNSHEFVYNLMRIREEINERVSKLGLVSAIQASMRFKHEQLEHPQAKVFGCEPDYCVWEQKENEKPSISPEAATLRTAGAHVHVSFQVGGKAPVFPDDIAQMEAIIMALDVFLGAPFCLMDQDKERRKLYGKAGAFRPKPEYGGVEYRVLSNYWTRSPVLMAYVYNQVAHAFKFLNKKANPRDWFSGWKEHVYLAINDGDKESAKYLVNSFQMKLPSTLDW